MHATKLDNISNKNIMPDDKGFFVARKIIVDKGDATKIAENVAAKKAALAGHKPEGLNWAVTGQVIGAPTPVILVLAHWTSQEQLQAFQASENYQKQKASLDEWTTQPTEDFSITLHTDAHEPQSGNILEIHSYVSANADKEFLTAEFTKAAPLVLGAPGFVALGAGTAATGNPDETKVFNATEWKTLENYKTHSESAAIKEVGAKVVDKLKDIKSYALTIL